MVYEDPVFDSKTKHATPRLLAVAGDAANRPHCASALQQRTLVATGAVRAQPGTLHNTAAGSLAGRQHRPTTDCGRAWFLSYLSPV